MMPYRQNSAVFFKENANSSFDHIPGHFDEHVFFKAPSIISESTEALSSTSYYQILGIPTDSTPEVIRRAYYALCKLHHPDKSQGAENYARLHSVQQAYNVLSDESKRILYDIRIGIYSGSDKMKKSVEIYQLQRSRSARDIENMRLEYHEKVKQEKERNGIIIVKALYGNLRLKSYYLERMYMGVIEEKHIEGPYLDVSIQLQCQIDKSRFIFTGGAGCSMELLKGFYNPCPCIKAGETCLYVLYEFNGALHEVTVQDQHYLAIPMKSHRVVGAQPRGPYSPANVVYVSPKVSTNTDAKPGNHQKISLLTERQFLAAMAEQRRRMRSLFFWSAVLTWSGAYLFVNLYERPIIIRVLNENLPSVLAKAFDYILPPSVAPEQKPFLNALLHGNFIPKNLVHST